MNEKGVTLEMIGSEISDKIYEDVKGLYLKQELQGTTITSNEITELTTETILRTTNMVTDLTNFNILRMLPETVDNIENKLGISAVSSFRRLNKLEKMRLINEQIPNQEVTITELGNQYLELLDWLINRMGNLMKDVLEKMEIKVEEDNQIK